MTLNISLSTESIRQAIIELRKAQDNIRWGLNQTIDMLVKEGTEIAQSAAGSMAHVIGYMPDETEGMILETGEKALIAEFGAGYDTLDPSALFENMPETEVAPTSYSRLVGSGEFWLTDLISPGEGYWHFGRQRYDRVPARQGLYKAKQHIQETAIETAKEVIKL